MKYMLTDGHGVYLRRDAAGCFVPVRNKDMGEKWDTRTKAANILRSSVSKNLRSRYTILEIDDEIRTVQAVQPPVSNADSDGESNTEQSGGRVVHLGGDNGYIKPNDDYVRQIGDVAIGEDKINDLVVSISNFSDFIFTTEERKNELLKALSDIDSEISDIHHYMEFGRFNAYQGWATFHMLQSRLKKRRKIKDELYILQQLGQCKVNSAMIENIKGSVSKLNDREYKPRRLMSLFGVDEDAG